MVEDARAEDIEEQHLSTPEQFQRVFGRVATTDEVAELRAALGAPLRASR
jgi:hypothetical protein